jgi:hypothetical protein
MDPTASLDAVEKRKDLPCRELNPGCLVAIPTRPRSLCSSHNIRDQVSVCWGEAGESLAI